MVMGCHGFAGSGEMTSCPVGNCAPRNTWKVTSSVCDIALRDVAVAMISQCDVVVSAISQCDVAVAAISQCDMWLVRLKSSVNRGLTGYRKNLSTWLQASRERHATMRLNYG